MHVKRYLVLIPLAISSIASAVIIRDDVDDSKYQIAASEFPALADLPGEGHGVLIAPQWVITAAHAAPADTEQVTVNGVSRKIKRVVIHPGYKKLPQPLIDAALSSGDVSKAMAFLAATDDVALVRLEAPVTDVKPVALFRGDDEKGQTVQLSGKGATGNGKDGEEPNGMHRTSLRRAFNVVTRADARWIAYTFDPPASALPLEGMTGSGDSGGPVLIKKQGEWQLAGLASWTYVSGDLHGYKPGLYGQDSYNVRISRYIDWIERVMSPAKAKSRTKK